MSRTIYSPGALATLPNFHRRKQVIYVEGQDDALFWRYVFEWASLKNFHFKIAGGSSEIDKFIARIVTTDAPIWAARDRDYADFDGSIVNHSRVIYTFGYSIENTIYCAPIIANAIQIHSRVNGNYVKRVERWMSRFGKRLRRPLMLDATNRKCGLGHGVLGSSCLRFTSVPSHDIDPAKVKAHCKTFNGRFKRADVSSVRNAFKMSGKHEWHLLRGHLISSGVAHFVRNESYAIGGRKVNISEDSLFAFALSQFLNTCAQRPDIQYLRERLARIKSRKKF